jgi:hypothetical protein
LQEFSRLRRLIALSAFNGKAGFVDWLRGLASWIWPGRIDPIARAGPAPLPHASQTPKAMRPKRILTVAEDAAQLTLIHSRTNKSGPNFQQNR